MSTNLELFTPLEKSGMALFFSERTNCSRCHAGPNFAAPDFVGGEYGSSFDAIHSNGNFGENLKGGANNGLDTRYSDG